MLRSCSETEFNLYVDFAYALALNPAKSGYPTYCDGVKTREMFVERLSKAFERDTEEILLFEYEGKMEGLIHYFWIPQDYYVEASTFNINKKTELAMEEFLELVGKKFPGYDLYLGFPEENESAIRSLKEHGAECIEDDYYNIALPDKMDHIPEVSGLIRINKDNYEIFRKLHDQIDGDMYWNSERIFKNLDNWGIFAVEKDGMPFGDIYYLDAKDGWFEIFGIDMDNDEFDPDIFKGLLQGALADVKSRGGHVLMFFCGEEGEKETLECGFTCVSRYICHKKYFPVSQTHRE